MNYNMMTGGARKAKVVAPPPSPSPSPPSSAAIPAPTYDEILRFFKSKRQYENNVIKAKSSKTARAARARGAQPPQAKCIHCGRAVGMKFSVKRGEYNAVCGDTVKPCAFKIFIQRNTNYLYRDFLRDSKQDVENVKMDIITSKLDLLFGYKTESETMEVIKKKLAEYSDENLLYNKTAEEYKNIVMSEERAAEIKKLQAEIEDDIHKIQTIAAAKIDPNLDEMIEIYRDRLQPNIEALRAKKYDVVELLPVDELNAADNPQKKLHYYALSLEKEYVRM